MLKRSFTQMWRGVIVGWIGGWDSPNGKRIKLMRHFYRYPEAWVAFLLFSMPLWVVKVIYQIYKKFK
jgi:hypothetical protein